MNTQIVKIKDLSSDSDGLDAAAKILRAGGLVAFPTETVYGLGANALSEAAVLKIYEAKGRPSDNPLIIHIAQSEDVFLFAKEVSQLSMKLMELFWPGPLTLIFKKTEIISHYITGGLDTVAIRLPSNPIARSIIQKAGCPIAAPSANRSGKPSPTRAKHVIEDLEGRVDMIVDGGKALIGLESTVLDVTGEIPIILRPGSITKSMLEEAVGTILVDQALLQVDEKTIPRAPGMKYKHYAPKGHLIVVEGTKERATQWINEQVALKISQGNKIAIIATQEDAACYQCENITLIGSESNATEIASNLFKVLRSMDEHKIEWIYTRAFSEDDIGMATMNRLMKAAGNQKVNLV
ncbi:MAG: threonylcarbamoyl-AMP synthase [Vallitaleaceae bacterium]|nr:threonylcarbamoyl-AMP synthase [Vallitaleaceae bacterium]